MSVPELNALVSAGLIVCILIVGLALAPPRRRKPEEDE